MCTAGFWKDENNVIHYFKNRMLCKMPKNQHIDFNQDGIFIKDENGRFEGMNKYGLYTVSLTMEPSIKRKLCRPVDINHDIMQNFKTAETAVKYFFEENKKYDMGFIELIGDEKQIFYIEVSPDQITCSDLSQAKYFACTNHGQLLVHQGNWQDKENSSHCRLSAAQEILRKTKNYEDLKKLLCSHKTGKNKNAICSHNPNCSYTVSAYLYTPANKSAEICINGFPCEKGFTKYNLDEKDKYGIYK